MAAPTFGILGLRWDLPRSTTGVDFACLGDFKLKSFFLPFLFSLEYFQPIRECKPCNTMFNAITCNLPDVDNVLYVQYFICMMCILFCCFKMLYWANFRCTHTHAERPSVNNLKTSIWHKKGVGIDIFSFSISKLNNVTHHFRQSRKVDTTLWFLRNYLKLSLRRLLAWLKDVMTNEPPGYYWYLRLNNNVKGCCIRKYTFICLVGVCVCVCKID